MFIMLSHPLWVLRENERYRVACAAESSRSITSYAYFATNRCAGNELALSSRREYLRGPYTSTTTRTRCIRMKYDDKRARACVRVYEARDRFIAVVPRFRDMNKNGRALKNQSSTVNFNLRPECDDDDLRKLVTCKTPLDVTMFIGLLKFI